MDECGDYVGGWNEEHRSLWGAIIRFPVPTCRFVIPAVGRRLAGGHAAEWTIAGPRRLLDGTLPEWEHSTL